MCFVTLLNVIIVDSYELKQFSLAVREHVSTTNEAFFSRWRLFCHIFNGKVMAFLLLSFSRKV